MTTNDVFQALITLIVALFGAFVIPYIKNRLGVEKYEYYKRMAKVAVQAMEMIFHEAGQGEIKKEGAMKFLRDLGITLSEEELSVLIESAVCELHEEL